MCIRDSPGAVAVVPLIGDDIILVKQYRPALGRELLEIPAGLRDIEGEDPIDTARRELIEEIGMRALSIEHVLSTHNAVGFSDECIHLFVSRDLVPVEREFTTSPEEQEMQIIRMPLAEAMAMISEGEITDAKTIIGVQHAVALLS